MPRQEAEPNTGIDENKQQRSRARSGGFDIPMLAAGAAVAGLAAYYHALPRKDPIQTQGMPERYLIDAPNRMDLQQSTECAAFSSAYVLRHLGTEADGNELYRGFPRKLLDGTVDPRGILVLFKKKGYRASFYRGSSDTLKKRISLGVPVIAFIKVNEGQRYSHFAPVVGYDNDYFYLADSLGHKSNCDGPTHNRKIPIVEFEKLWRTNPFYKQSYIVASR